MRFLRPRSDLPPDVRSRVGEKVLAAAEAGEGVWLVGTRDALVAVDPTGSTAMSLPWEQVHRADWDAESSTLRVEEVAEFGQLLSTYSFVLAEASVLLELVRERVTASVLLQRRTELDRRRGFSVIGRRAPAGRGAVTWAYELDPGVDPDDPAVMAAAQVALHQARESLGL